MFKEWSLRPNSAGAGQHRGGLGAVYEIELLEENARAFLFGERGRFAPKGIAGGQDGAKNHFAFQQSDGWQEPPMTSKMLGIELTRGQSVRLETPGGGGYGPASERDAQAIARDVAQGFLTEDEATRLYGTRWQEAAS